MARYIVLVPRLEETGPVIIAREIAKGLKASGMDVEIKTLNKTITGSSEGIPCSRFTLKDILQLNKSDIVHSHTLRPDIICGLISIFTQAKTVTTIHSFFEHALAFDYGVFKSKISYLLWSFFVNRIDKRVFISNAMQRYYKYKLKNESSYVIRNWRKSDCQIINPDERYIDFLNKNKNRTIVGFCGSLDERKNILKLIENIKGGMCLVIIGDGHLKSNVLNMIEAKDNIIYLGRKNNAHMYFSQFDALVLPSFAEGIPTVCIEAAMHGVPSIMSNIAVHRELSKDGIGVTFNHKSFSDFNEKLSLTKSMSRDAIRDVWTNKYNGSLGIKKYRSLIKNDKN